MKRKNFTLFEIIIVVIILGMLATLAMPLYNKAIENAKSRACELNLQALLAAIEAYTAECDAFPATLSALPHQYIEKAFAQLTEKEGKWKVNLVYFLVGFDRSSRAFARNLIAGDALAWVDNYVKEKGVMHCPAKHGTGRSYGVNGFLTGKTLHGYDAISGNLMVVADCDNDTFNQASDSSDAGGLAARHKDYSIVGQVEYYAHGARKNKKIKKQHQ